MEGITLRLYCDTVQFSKHQAALRKRWGRASSTLDIVFDKVNSGSAGWPSAEVPCVLTRLVPSSQSDSDDGVAERTLTMTDLSRCFMREYYGDERSKFAP